jgi:choline dehydrogenase-like flavoprotein
MPIAFAEHVVSQGHRGDDLRSRMRDYVHWANLGALCEFLPMPDNRVTLAEESDANGLPVARFSYSRTDNDHALMKVAGETMEEIMRAAGATETMTIERYAHLVGGARMGSSPSDGVVDHTLRTFAIPNLYLTDGSVLPTQGSANPALTIMSLAARAADLMARGGAR